MLIIGLYLYICDLFLSDQTLRVYMDDMNSSLLQVDKINLAQTVGSLPKTTNTNIQNNNTNSSNSNSSTPSLSSDGKAWIGFTAATGGISQNHDILSWSLKYKSQQQ